MARGGGKTAVPTSSSISTGEADGPLATGEWYVGAPIQGTHAAEDGYGLVMLVRRVVAPVTSNDGGELALGGGALTGFIWAIGRTAASEGERAGVSGAALGYHSARGTVEV